MARSCADSAQHGQLLRVACVGSSVAQTPPSLWAESGPCLGDSRGRFGAASHRGEAGVGDGFSSRRQGWRKGLDLPALQGALAEKVKPMFKSRKLSLLTSGSNEGPKREGACIYFNGQARPAAVQHKRACREACLICLDSMSECVRGLLAALCSCSKFWSLIKWMVMGVKKSRKTFHIRRTTVGNAQFG